MPETQKLSKRLLPYILSFFIPFIIVGIIYIMRGVWPFGDSMYLRSDMYHQYAPFHKELWRKLTEGGSLTYSWNIGMGVNFTSLIAYYLASPFNLLLLLVPEAHITTFMDLLIMLKIGLSGLTFCVYVIRHFGKHSLAATGFAILYALSSYTAAFCWNLMWWDCIWLFPLVMLGIERLVKQKKCFLYAITLGAAIFSNYYIGIMLCIISVLYFLVVLISNEEKKDSGYFISRLWRFGLFSLLAGGLAACLILPEYYTLMLSASGDSTFPTELNNYFPILDMISRSLINVEPSVFMAHEPNLYCGILVFVFLPLYLIGTNGNQKEKIGKFLLLALLLISFNMNIPNYIWHGFHFPNSLACRESFIYIFLLLTMCCEAFFDLIHRTKREIIISLSVALGLFILIEQIYVGEDYDFSIVYISMIFAVLYAYLANTFRNRKTANNTILVFSMLIVIVAETTINIDSTGFSVTSRTSYLSDNQAIAELLQEAEEYETAYGKVSFYRVEKENHRTKNDAAWHGYRGISTFLSTANAGVGEFLSNLGMEQSFNAYSYYGATPLSNAIFSVKYLLAKSSDLEDDVTRLFSSSEAEYLYENLYTLPIGFMIPFDEKDNEEPMVSGDPFDEQNRLASRLSGLSDLLFTEVSATPGDTAVIEQNSMDYAGETGARDIYFHVTSGSNSVTATVYDASGELVSTRTFDDLDRSYICHAGIVPEGGKVTVHSNDDNNSRVILYAYEFHFDVFEKMYNRLNASSLTLTDMSDTMIEGTVTVDQAGIMFTSIPYEKGWHVTVDGTEIDTQAFQNAFISFDLSEGPHIITMKFRPEGLTAGLWISGICLFLLLLIALATYIVSYGRDNKYLYKEKEKSLQA